MPTRPVIDHGRCEAKRDCVRVCPYDVFEVRRMDPDDFTALNVLESLGKSGKGKVAAILPDTTSSTRYVEFDQPMLKKALLAAGVPASANPGGHVGRGVPDVSGDADPNTGYAIRVDGTDTVIGGTSAVAPLWAALIALINQQSAKPAGFVNALLYGSGQSAFRDITSGNNGAYSAKAGWDACTGLGSPDGARVLTVIK